MGYDYQCSRIQSKTIKKIDRRTYRKKNKNWRFKTKTKRDKKSVKGRGYAFIEAHAGNIFCSCITRIGGGEARAAISSCISQYANRCLTCIDPVTAIFGALRACRSLRQKFHFTQQKFHFTESSKPLGITILPSGA